MIMQRLIQNKLSEAIIILDYDNSFISNDHKIDNHNEIDNLNNLSSDIFDNFNLYLGKDYDFFNIDVDFIKNLLLNKDIYKDNNHYKLKDQYLYYYNEKNRYLSLEYDNIWLVLESKFGLNWVTVKPLCTGILEQHYNWKVDTTATVRLRLMLLLEQHYNWKVDTTSPIA